MHNQHKDFGELEIFTYSFLLVLKIVYYVQIQLIVNNVIVVIHLMGSIAYWIYLNHPLMYGPTFILNLWINYLLINLNSISLIIRLDTLLPSAMVIHYWVGIK